MSLLLSKPTQDQKASRKSQKHSQKVLENAKKSFQHWQTNSSQELAKSEKEWLQNFLDKPDIRYVTGQKITVMLGKLMVKASMSRNNILCGQPMIYKISQTEVL